jgi:uncharacterized protein (TIGR02145 family)
MRNLALMWVLAACLLGCGGKPPVSTFTDTRDGKTYKIVKIGSQTWFAENLNYAAEGSRCYEDSPDSCAKYGRLYSWEMALKVCPAGFHLPTREEWKTLADYAGGDSTAGKKLKSADGWDKNGNGTNEYGFSALPGGSSAFRGTGDYGIWWSATELASFDWWSIYAFTWNLNYNNEYENLDVCHKIYSYSVRCVLDNLEESQK